MSRKLHIGGKIPAPGWEILNVIPGPYTDHVYNANDLSQFTDCIFSEIYASHIVEHLDYKGELLSTLKEWKRVLEPGGKIYISVPDVDVLAKLFLEKGRLTFGERFHVMRMIFGGHVDAYDYHVVGLNEEFLISFLRDAGFESMGKVDEFGIFQDTSSMRFKEELISLNLIAVKPTEDKYKNTRRNDPCPCNSGKKYKHCHGKIA
ncbi:MAG TPA: methyltransferase domain-containing protein [Gammaproteobacteria bacterium]|nr:methyltransferase domain-containing protein [Gammaproteobacteria bacterium]